LKSTKEFLFLNNNNKHLGSSFGVSKFEVGDEPQKSTLEDNKRLQVPKACMKHDGHKCQKISIWKQFYEFFS
jgi:hypothetical protein